MNYVAKTYSQTPSIRIDGLSKTYRLAEQRERYQTFRDLFSRTFRRGMRKTQSTTPESIWALKGVSFDVQPGEVVGIIGRNGAGKSTLLKILSRITEPTHGYAQIRGRVGSLLEVGAGFHPELTGRENIYLNSAILGMRKAEVARKIDEIVAFAEIEKFIEMPVKHYSSGMYMRLAFSVAAHFETEILFVDEVLAVGDAAFQKKCIGKMSNVAKDGRTVLFVSHNMSAVRGLCQRAIWLDKGEAIADGDVYNVLGSYMSSISDKGFSHQNRDYDFSIENVAIKNGRGECASAFKPGEDLTVEIAYDAGKPIKEPYIYLIVKSAHGSCFTANMGLDGNRPPVLDGKGLLCCRFKSIPLLPQSYTVHMAIRTREAKDDIISPQEVGSFYVACDLEDYGLKGDLVHGLVAKSFPVIIPYEWTLPHGVIAKVSLEAPSTLKADSTCLEMAEPVASSPRTPGAR